MESVVIWELVEFWFWQVDEGPQEIEEKVEGGVSSVRRGKEVVQPEQVVPAGEGGAFSASRARP